VPDAAVALIKKPCGEPGLITAQQRDISQELSDMNGCDEAITSAALVSLSVIPKVSSYRVTDDDFHAALAAGGNIPFSRHPLPKNSPCVYTNRTTKS